MSRPDHHALAARIAELARMSADARGRDEILAGVTAAAVELIPGVDTAGILLIRRDGYESVAGTTDIPDRLDELQMTLDEGPCRQAALNEVEVRIDDFRSDSRWPKYSPAVVEIGVLSGISFKMFTADRTAGALSFFGYQPRAWTASDLALGGVLAAHATAAILAKDHEEQLETALLTRDRIGQAKGIIMERFGVDDDAAFMMLRRLSQENNTKLAELAQRVIESR